MKFKTLAVLGAFGVIGLMSGCATTGATTTNYAFNQPVVGGMSINSFEQVSRNVLRVSRSAVNSSVGSIRITGNVMDTCLNGNLDAAVIETTDAIVVMPVKPMAACYESRITIKKDGSGGFVERRAFKGKTFDIAWPEHNWGLTKL